MSLVLPAVDEVHGDGVDGDVLQMLQGHGLPVRTRLLHIIRWF